MHKYILSLIFIAFAATASAQELSQEPKTPLDSILMGFAPDSIPANEENSLAAILSMMADTVVETATPLPLLVDVDSVPAPICSLPVAPEAVETPAVVPAPEAVEVASVAPAPVVTPIVMPVDTFVSIPINPELVQLPKSIFLPAIYLPYSADIQPLQSAYKPEINPLWPWLSRAIYAQAMADYIRQNHTIHHMADVHLNLYTLPEPPKTYVLTVDPEKASYVFTEAPMLSTKPVTVASAVFNKQHWLNKLRSNVQWSQAFVSDNWYQGGNSYTSMLFDFTYDSKLNTKFHPKLLFENYFQWRTAIQEAEEDDPYRKFNITENRFQVNSKFGYKASRKWYYTINSVFKTPVLTTYKKGTDVRNASLMSPGELNVGIGMTFNHKSKKGNFELGLTIAPLSYNLKTCLDPKLNPKNFGIKDEKNEGARTYSTYGSNTEITCNWKMFYNVNYHSRLFAFSNYEANQMFIVDWQHRVTLTVNRFLTANVTVDMRHDSSMEPAPDDKWGKFQLRELFTLGFTYTFNH